MPKELNFIIQGWEDVSFYPCGLRQINYGQAWKNCKHDLKEYNLTGYSHRIIKRYEPMED